MASKKFYTVEKEIGGRRLVAQFNGVAAATEAIDSTYIDGTSVTSSKKLAEYVLKNVIVDPKLTMDDFDSIEELNEVIQFGQNVMMGNFRDEKVEGKA